MNTAQTPPPVEPPRNERKKPWLRWVLLGCGGAVAVAALLVVGLLLLVKHATAEPEKVVNTFLFEAAAGNYETAHDCFSSPLKEAQPLEEFAAGVDANSHLFDVAEVSFSERAVDMQGAKLSGTLTLTSSTEVSCSFELVREHGNWKLIAYNIGSGGVD
jgi:hypothetical protein